MGRGGLPQGPYEEDWVLGLGSVGSGVCWDSGSCGNMDALQIRVQLCLKVHGNLELKEEKKVREAEGLSPSNSVRRLSCSMYECLEL